MPFCRDFASAHLLSSVAYLAVLLLLTGCPDDPANLTLDNDQQNSGTADTGTDDAGPDEPDVDFEEGYLDLLMVIDNSGNMCNFQREFRETLLSEMIETLKEQRADLHVGITTTHSLDCDDLSPGDQGYEAACVREPLARRAHLQSTPQPIPGFDTSCYHPRFHPNDPEVTADPDSAPFAGDLDITRLDPIQDVIELAVSCTGEPERWEHLTEPDETALRCSLTGTPGVTQEDCQQPSELEDFFPPADAYREIPTVLRSQDYQDAHGEVDWDAFGDDLRCASAVGTRGHGFPQGLSVAVEAVSPALTGGPNAQPGSAPNAGFLRPNVATHLLFLSSRNDCSHDGSLNESTACGFSNCAIEEARGEEGALLSTETLAPEFVENLAQTKGHPIPWQGLTTLAIVGPEERLDPAVVPEQCEQPWSIEPSCTTTVGRGWSGHRYAEFVTELDACSCGPASVCAGTYDYLMN